MSHPYPNTIRNTCAWNIAGTNTFRLASKKLFGNFPNECGTNLQNPSNRLCGIYGSDEGRSFVQRDQSGAEALIVAGIAPIGNLRKLFECGIKPHTYVAIHLFPHIWRSYITGPIEEYLTRPIEQLKSLNEFGPLCQLIKESDHNPPDKRYYYIGKKTCHSGNYGQESGGLREVLLEETEGALVLSKDEAERLTETYHRIFPEIKIWHHEIKKTLERTGTLHNLFGYPRTFYNVNTPEDLKKAFAFIGQSTVATITNLAVTQTQDYIEEHRRPWDIMNNKHDSFMVQCPDNDIEEVKDIMGKNLCVTLTGRDGVQFTMKSEAAVGKNWGHYDKDTNPEGLR